MNLVAIEERRKSGKVENMEEECCYGRMEGRREDMMGKERKEMEGGRVKGVDRERKRVMTGMEG